MSKLFIPHVGEIICDARDAHFILACQLRLVSKGYVYARHNGRDMGLHRWIAERVGWNLDFEIDHENGNKLDVRLENLRQATRTENAQNTGAHSNSKTGMKGVRLRSNGRYDARIHAEGRRYSLGTFDTLIQAAEAYQAAADYYHRQFAKT